MQLTKHEQKVVEEIHKRQNGWPVGIPVDEKDAKNLVEKGLAEWAQPFWAYNNPVFSVRLTGSGQYYVKYPDNCDHNRVVNHVCVRCKQECYTNAEWDEIDKLKTKKQSHANT